MNKIAIDIVLLPSLEIMDIAIKANKELLKQYPDKIILNKDNCLPHISLAMGCIEEQSIPDACKKLEIINKNYILGPLKFAGFSIKENSIGEKITSAKIERSKSLQLLHEEVMTHFVKHFSYEVQAEMLISENVSDSSLHWIRNYPANSSYENFEPHITLGYGQIKNCCFPSQITISELAIYHLGNHCTCRKNLFSISIKK